MARVTRRENYRVVIEPKNLGRWANWSPEREAEVAQQTCESIKEQVQRHVDEIACVDVVYDEQGYCEHCNYNWTEDSDTYNGGCCDEDEKAAPSEEAT